MLVLSFLFRLTSVTDEDYKGNWYNLTAMETEFNDNGNANPSANDLDSLGFGPGLGDSVDYTQDITSDGESLKTRRVCNI